MTAGHTGNAGELVAQDPDGRSVRLGDLAAVSPLVVCFLRHFG